MYYYKATKKQGVGQMIEMVVSFELRVVRAAVLLGVISTR